MRWHPTPVEVYSMVGLALSEGGDGGRREDRVWDGEEMWDGREREGRGRAERGKRGEAKRQKVIQLVSDVWSTRAECVEYRGLRCELVQERSSARYVGHPRLVIHRCEPHLWYTVAVLLHPVTHTHTHHPTLDTGHQAFKCVAKV